MRTCLFVILLFILPSVTSAQVINEVMWAGSDQSTADEWLELLNPFDHPVDLGGWTVTFVDSSGAERTMLTIPSGTILEQDSYYLIANDPASNSRLVVDANLVTTAVSLANSKLLLRLRDEAGTVIDTVDDGVGNPFAGSNTAPKASMERIDPLISGNVASNWATATVALGFDDGAPLLGTPGYPNSVYVPPASSSSGSSSSSSSSSALSESSSSSLASSVSSSESSVSFSSELSTSSSSTTSGSVTELTVCTDDLEVEIHVQSGELRAQKKTTVNLEAVATKGTLPKDACRFDFGDGKTSESCNPGPHAFTEVGTYTVHLEAKNQCGNTLIQELLIEVLTDPSSPSSGAPSSSSSYDGSRLRFSSALPNPEGADTGHEFIEIRNLEEHPVSLEGWTLGIGVETVKKTALHGIVESLQTRRIYSSEIPFSLQNANAKVQLLDPYGQSQSLLLWQDAVEGRVYYPEDLRKTGVRGKVLRLLDPQTLEVQVEWEARTLIPEGFLQVHVLGLTFPNLTKENEQIFSASFKVIEDYRALIENKNFELEFDSNIWSKAGILQGYVYIDGALSVAENLLLHGASYVDTTCDCSRLDQLKEFEEFARKKKIGVWSLEEKLTSQLSVQKSGTSATIITAENRAQSIQITEVFSHPMTSELESLSEEWIELKNPEETPASLSGWTLQIGSKKRVLGSSFSLGSGAYLVLNMADLKLQLRDNGNAVQLFDPSGRVVSSIDYPKLKAGVSFGVGQGNALCELREPSPGADNACAGPALSRSKKAKQAAALKAAKKTAEFSASYRSDLPADPRVLSVSAKQSATLPALLGVFLGVTSTFGLLKLRFI